MRVAIIGGGISGLASAFYIKHFNPKAQVTIFEKEPNLGGKIATTKKGEFLFEAGSNGFLSNKEETFEFINLLGLNDLLLKSNDSSRIRYIYDKEKLKRLPSSPKEFLTTNILPPLAKLRVAKEYFIKPKLDDIDETMFDFGNRRLGKEFTRVFLEPMSAGIYGSTARLLSIHSAFPKIIQMEREYGSLFKAMKKRKKGGSPTGVLTSFKGGMSSFITALEKKLQATIFKNTEVRKITKEKNRFDDTVYQIEFKELDVRKDFTATFDKVIFSTPADATSKLFLNLDREVANYLAGIKYIPMSLVGFGYDSLNTNLNAFGLLTTKESQKDILGALFDSSIFNDRAESGKSIRFMIGGARDPKLAFESEDELINICKAEARDILKIDKEPSEIFIKRWNRAIPSYEVGHKRRVEKIFKLLSNHENLFLNSNAYFGVGFNDCIINSIKIAKEALKDSK